MQTNELSLWQRQVCDLLCEFLQGLTRGHTNKCKLNKDESVPEGEAAHQNFTTYELSARQGGHFHSDNLCVINLHSAREGTPELV